MVAELFRMMTLKHNRPLEDRRPHSLGSVTTNGRSLNLDWPELADQRPTPHILGEFFARHCGRQSVVTRSGERCAA